MHYTVHCRKENFYKQLLKLNRKASFQVLTLNFNHKINLEGTLRKTTHKSTVSE